MFFEPPPAPPPEEEERPAPPWLRPPEGVLGELAISTLVLARSEEGLVALREARAYPEGCTFEIITAGRRTRPGADWDLRTEARTIITAGMKPAGPVLQDELIRFGVQLPDGAKATTLEGLPRGSDEEPPPEPPTLTAWMNRSGHMAARHRLIDFVSYLWLWPLPPAETFDLVVEWPTFGIPLTRTPMDGAAIAEASRRATSYWPDLG